MENIRSEYLETSNTKDNSFTKGTRGSRDQSYLPGSGRSTATNTPKNTPKKGASTRMGNERGRERGGVLVSSRDNNRYNSTTATSDDEVDVSYEQDAPE